MDLKAYLNEKLSKLLFTEINKGAVLGNYKLNKDIYIPLRPEQIVNKVKEGDTLSRIPLLYYVEGMTYVLGADEDFKFNDIYKEILESTPDNIKYIKGKIYKEVNESNYEDAFILLKGLVQIESNKENLDKLLLVLDKLRNSDKAYTDEELTIIERAKSLEDFASPYLYEALIYTDNKDFVKALHSLNTYLSKGGEETPDITELKQNLININNYDKGKELCIEEPKEALGILLPLIDVFGDSAELFYHIAVAYRNLGIHEKAIYYLNEATAIDDALIEVYNEYGINYASLGDYSTAVEYFRKVFEPTKSIEICTNIIMCYLQMGKLQEAKDHLEIAKIIDPKDEIVLQLKEIIEAKCQ